MGQYTAISTRFFGIAIASALVALSGCASQLSPAQQSSLSMANAQPLSFAMNRESAVDAWGRAQSFIGRFSSMKLQVTTDYVIQTYNPNQNDLGIEYGYNVTKTPVGTDVQFDVECTTNNMLNGGQATQNAHILAYYMATGQLLTFAIR